MKRHFKLILAALSAFLLFVSNVPAVSAAETDKTSVSVRFTSVAGEVDWDYMDCTLSCDKPIYLYYSVVGDKTYIEVFSGDKDNFNINSPGSKYGSLGYNVRSTKYDYGGNPSLGYNLFGTAVKQGGKDLYQIETTATVFSSIEALQRYLELGIHLNEFDYTYMGFLKTWNDVKGSWSNGYLSAHNETTYVMYSTDRFCFYTVNNQYYVMCKEDTKCLTTTYQEKWYEEGYGNGTVYEPTTTENTIFFDSGYNKYFVSFDSNKCQVTIPVFPDEESARLYIETGAHDDQLNFNPEDGGDEIRQDHSLPYLQDVKYIYDGNFNKGFPYEFGHEITWSTSESYESGWIEIKVECDVKFSDLTKTLTLDLTTVNGRRPNHGCTYESGIYRVSEEYLSDWIGRSEEITELLKKNALIKVTPKYFYVRLALSDGRASGWTRITCGGNLNNSSLDVGKTETGLFNRYGEFVPDTDSDDSYVNIRDPWTGKYDFEEKDENGGSNIPTNAADALNQFVDIIGSLMSSMGKVPALVKTVFGFLPNIFFILIGCMFTIIVILRILGR